MLVNEGERKSQIQGHLLKNVSSCSQQTQGWMHRSHQVTEYLQSTFAALKDTANENVFVYSHRLLRELLALLDLC